MVHEIPIWDIQTEWYVLSSAGTEVFRSIYPWSGTNFVLNPHFIPTNTRMKHFFLSSISRNSIVEQQKCEMAEFWPST